MARDEAGINYRVVGHRGCPAQYPENTLPGFIAAAKAGVKYLELDVRVSCDGTPVVFHDENLDRVTESSGLVSAVSAEELGKISCHEPGRFGSQFYPTPIATLAEVCLTLKEYDVHVFVELKEEALNIAGRAAFFEAVLQACHPILSCITIISFDLDVLKLAKQEGLPIGWVLRCMDNDSLELARALDPEVLIYDVKRLQLDDSLWEGGWHWFLYDIVDPELALFWHKKGVTYIESWDPIVLSR